jgi:hypothetical protein
MTVSNHSKTEITANCKSFREISSKNIASSCVDFWKCSTLTPLNIRYAVKKNLLM